MPKKKIGVRITVTLPEPLVEWLDEGVRKGVFASLSHGVRQCIAIAKTYMPHVKIEVEKEKTEEEKA